MYFSAVADTEQVCDRFTVLEKKSVRCCLGPICLYLIRFTESIGHTRRRITL